MNGHSIHKITHNALPYLDPRFSPGSLTPPAAEQPRSLCPPNPCGGLHKCSNYGLK
ncbi:hypothetical protein BBTM_02203 [Bifidobacterium bifidum]|nr:hypothetical protein BBTM_02203 [Bifidobacterium bifidum]